MALRKLLRHLPCLLHTCSRGLGRFREMCSRLACLPQSGKPGLSVNLHVYRLDGVGRTLYTAFNRNFTWCHSMVQMSCHVSALSCTLSHLVQLPCLPIATALACLLSSSILWISFCTIPYRSFGSAFLQLALVVHPRSPSLVYGPNDVSVVQAVFCTMQCPAG